MLFVNNKLTGWAKRLDKLSKIIVAQQCVQRVSNAQEINENVFESAKKWAGNGQVALDTAGIRPVDFGN